ncbi:MAG: MFS transporter, partial [Verrucomicrobiota bacterium]
MKSSSSLLKPYTLVGAQALNSFSDHVCKIVASGLVAATMPEHRAAVWVGIVSFLYIVPYIVLAPFFGKLTRKWSKSALVRFSYGLQLGATGVIGVGAWIESFGLMVAGLAGVAAQSGVLAPARNALMKDLVGDKRIGQFMGLLELAGISATLAGLAMGGWSFDALWQWAGSPWNAVAYAAMGSMVFATIALIAILGVRSDKDVLDTNSVFFGSIVKEIVAKPALRWTVLGLTWFYGAGVMIVMILMQHGRWEHGQNVGAASDGGMLAATLGVGAALGSGVAALLCRRRIEIGWSFIGAIGMMVFLPLTSMAWEHDVWAKMGIFVSGFMAGLFSAPLNGLFVALSRDDARASTLAAGNLFMNLGCAAFVGLQVFLTRVLEWGPDAQLMLMGVMSVFVVIWMSYLVPESLIRVALLSVMKVVYPMKVRNLARLPEKGGVLMISNHVTFADAAILYAASNRPVRFIGGPSSFKFPMIKWAYKRFNVINISSGKAKEAITK